MVFGATQGSGLGGIKKALGNEGAVSERARLEYIKAEKDRLDRDRTKRALEEKKKKLEHNKRELSQRTIELRRLQSEIIHSEAILNSIDTELKTMENHVAELHAKHNDLIFHANEHKRDMDKHRERFTKEGHLEHQIEQELHALELKMGKQKEAMAAISKSMDDLNLQIMRLTRDAERVEAEIQHNSSQKQYKSREVEARKRTVKVLGEKKLHEISEIRRLESENVRLESDIQALERLAHN